MNICPACGGALTAWRTAPAAEAGLGGFKLLRCASCGTAVTVGSEPVGADLHETGAYAPVRPRGAWLAAPLLRVFDAQRLSFVRRVVNPPAVLVDAGAGRGRFVAHANAVGYEARGLEPTARGVDAARDVYGVSLERSSIESARVEPGSVDAITLWHVLEHVHDPAATLRVLRAWLAPSGAIVIGVPNLASWQARVGGGRWYHLDLPRHCTHFTAGGLRSLLEAQGFKVVETHHVLAEQNPFGMWQSAVSRVTSRPSYIYNLLKRNASVRSLDLVVTVLALPLVPVAVLVELVAGLRRRGGTIAVVARRRD